MTTTPHKRAFGPLDALFLYCTGFLLLLLALAVLVPALMGLTPYVVTSSSMAPTLARGDLVFAAPAALGELAPGSIVTYRGQEGALTHRVYSVDAEASSLRTKADSSLYLDAAPVTQEALLGRVVYKLPLAGYLALWLGSGEVSS